MSLLDIVESEWIQNKPFVEKRLERFHLEEYIQKYVAAGERETIGNALHTYFMMQFLFYQKLKFTYKDDALAFGTYIGAKAGKKQLLRSNEENVAYPLLKRFGNKKIDFQKTFPEPVIALLEIYCEALERESANSIRALTHNFFDWNVGCSLQYLHESAPLLLKECEGKQVSIRGEQYHLELEKDFSRFSASSGGSREERFLRTGIDFSLEQLQQNGTSNAERKRGKDAPMPPHIYVAGHQRVKEELKKIGEIVKHLDYFKKYVPLQKLLKNYLLVGPPGTGKTTLVTSLAEESGLYFLNVPCVRLGSSYYNETASRVDAVYEKTAEIIDKKQYKGVLLFFDEFDHIARKRGTSHSAEDDKITTTLNNRLDGAGSIPGVITIGATNKLEQIDEALLSRFYLLQVGYPQTAEEIVAIHQAIIEKLNDYAGIQQFGAIDFHQILPFIPHRESLKSGRVIEHILTHALIEKHLRGLGDDAFLPVTTDDIHHAYVSYLTECQQENRQYAMPSTQEGTLLV